MIAKIERASDYEEKRNVEINTISDLETLCREAKANTITGDYFGFHGLIVNFYEGEMHITIYDDFME